MVLCGTLITLGVSVHRYYHEVALSRTANGVGQESEKGMSPLGFHSALGSTNQPSALVRLHGDYQENPFLPMLYMREAALSEFNGKELVLAAEHFNPDVAFGTPAQTFERKEDPRLGFRVPVVHSVYTLTRHDRAFGIDYPVSIKPVKNPKPGRFERAFQVYSLAPAMSLEELLGLPVGDPEWTEEERQHFLVPHSDPRYANLAKEITSGVQDSASRAFALTQYLSKKAIYTLTPEHEVEDGEDPVAPFLFGDLRGYCVHFAHATVYMLRSLGIPSRIATGYLTDLSQARDGHILLRMADRHAWAEVYFAGVGWVPFDTQPEQVESHAELEVDMGLLEELMGMIGPDEDLLPDELVEDEANYKEPVSFPLPSTFQTLVIFLALAMLLLISKYYLRYGWKLYSDKKRLQLCYRALVSTWIDLGFTRHQGETRSEHASRISREISQPSPLRLTPTFLKSVYSTGSINADSSDSFFEGEKDIFSRIPVWKRILAFLNPASLLQCFLIRRW